jgi:hypothetical protein
MMTMATARKTQPQNPPVDDATVALLRHLISLHRETNEHLAAIRKQGEVATSENPNLIDSCDLMAPKAAAAMFGITDDRMYRWMKREPKIVVHVGGTDYVSRRRLEEKPLPHRRD